MPEIKIKCISSFSSEDKVYKAENILKPETFRKWKCATPGEKSASVVFQFEKANLIHSLDIGNESSAFVEVFVGRSSFKLDEYQVLLVSSSFMTPLESRNENNTNRVRMFDNEKLCENTKKEKWDCIQVVCTQPFNKNIQYGLSFIKFHSPPEPEVVPQTKQPELNLGIFKLKDDDEEDEDSFKVGNWFNRRNDKPNSATNPAAIRQAAAVTASTSNNERVQLQPTPTGTSSLKRKFENNEDSPDLKAKKDSITKKAEKEKVTKENTQSAKKVLAPAKTSDQKARERNEKVLAAARADKVKKAKPFHELMNKVIFALSGFQNPFRSDIRDRALQMGAKYKADWDSSCTHLVCAFLNTPKFLQVQGMGGKIVKKEWIFESYSRKALLPWRRYMLGSYAQSDTEDESSEDGDYAHSVTADESSEEETVFPVARNAQSSATTIRALAANVPSTSERLAAAPAALSASKASPKSKTKSLDDDDSSAMSDYDAHTEKEDSEDNDTEDELRKSEKKFSEQRKKQHTTTNGIVGEKDLTERPDTKDLPLPHLPDWFKGKLFFLYGDFPKAEKHDLERYITAFNGSMVNYMAEDVRYVVTNHQWNENFDDALSENEKLIFVRPQWILKCNDFGKLVPFQPYIVVPDK